MNEALLFQHYKSNYNKLPQAIKGRTSYPIAYIFEPVTKDMFDKYNFRYFTVFHNGVTVLMSRKGFQTRTGRAPTRSIIAKLYRTYIINNEFRHFIENMDGERLYAVELYDDKFVVQDVFHIDGNDIVALHPKKWDVYRHTMIYEFPSPDDMTFDFIMKIVNSKNAPIVLRDYCGECNSVAKGVMAGIIYPVRSDNKQRIVEYVRFYFGNNLSREEFNKIMSRHGFDDDMYDMYLESVSKRW